MKILATLVLPLLLLASAAWAEDEELAALEAGIANTESALKVCEEKAEFAEDPEQRAALHREAEKHRIRLANLRAQLEAVHSQRAQEDYDEAVMHARARDLFDRFQSDRAGLEAQRAALLRMKAKLDEMGPDRPERVRIAAELRALEVALARFESLEAVAERTREAIEQGRLDEARLAYERASQEHADLLRMYEMVKDQAAAAARQARQADRPFHSGKGPFPLHVKRLAPEEERKQIEHLQAAARHLREAGLVDRAEKLEAEINSIEDSRRRMALASFFHPEQGHPVYRAVQDLRREVRALRNEVLEMKQILLEERRAR